MNNSTTSDSVEAPVGSVGGSHNRYLRLAGSFALKYPTVILLLLLGAVFSLASDQFLTSSNLTTLINAQAVVALVTLAALLPLISGEFDLSLGYMAGVVTMLGAYLAGHGWAALPLIAAVLIAGGLVGAANAILAVRFQVSSVIATLGVGIMLTGATQALSGGQVLFEGIPEAITSAGTSKVLDIAYTSWAVIAIAILLFYLLEFTPLGRRLYATGASERVAYLAGVSTGWMKALGFMIAGVVIGIAGVVQLGTTGSASPTFGAELLLPAYAGAFLSVVAYRPGYFNVPGAVIAILVIAVGSNGLSLIGVPSWGQPVFNGAVLVLAVLGARAESRQVKIG